MKMQGVKSGDIVQCDIRGARFLAFYLGRDGAMKSRHEVQPFKPEVYGAVRLAKTREVIAHWSKRKT